MHDQTKGALCLSAGLLCYGLGSTILKRFYRLFPDVSSRDIVFFRIFIASLVFFVITLLLKPSAFKIKPSDLLYFAIFGIAGIFVVQFFLMHSISLISVGTATFTQASSSVMLCVYSVAILKEKLHLNKIIGLILGFLGLFLIFYTPNLFKGSELLGLGLLSALLSAVGKTFYILYGKKGAKRYYTPAMMAYSLLFASMMALSLSRPHQVIRAHGATPVFWVYVVTIAMVASVFALLFYMYGISKLPASNVAIMNVIEPAAGALTAFVFLGELLTAQQILACFFIMLGNIVLNLKINMDKNIKKELL